MRCILDWNGFTVEIFGAQLCEEYELSFLNNWKICCRKSWFLLFCENCVIRYKRRTCVNSHQRKCWAFRSLCSKGVVCVFCPYRAAMKKWGTVNVQRWWWAAPILLSLQAGLSEHFTIECLLYTLQVWNQGWLAGAVDLPPKIPSICFVGTIFDLCRTKCFFSAWTKGLLFIPVNAIVLHKALCQKWLCWATRMVYFCWLFGQIKAVEHRGFAWRFLV